MRISIPPLLSFSIIALVIQPAVALAHRVDTQTSPAAPIFLPLSSPHPKGIPLARGAVRFYTLPERRPAPRARVIEAEAAVPSHASGDEQAVMREEDAALLLLLFAGEE